MIFGETLGYLCIVLNKSIIGFLLLNQQILLLNHGCYDVNLKCFKGKRKINCSNIVVINFSVSFIEL